ncbi:MAG: hypothetical protein ACD_73C00279G0008 [uncultured bacterium]|nr:MAG: hypothetical protein ACD_73C00279G0008 [uncultured bacterium]
MENRHLKTVEKNPSPNTPIPDEELMLAFQKGDVHAFNELLKRHQGGIYNFLVRFLGNSENAEEAFQEVFVRVIKASESYSPQAKFSTWVYTIARNYCIDLSRKGKFRKVLSLDDKTGDKDSARVEDRLMDEKADPQSYVLAKNMNFYLEKFLNVLNADQKEVFLLRERQGLPFEEIAQIVGTSVNTVKSRMRYALLFLQDEFKKIGITKPK